jgi:hypothetical protein
MVTKFPRAGLHDPQTNETIYRNETVVTRSIGKLHFRSYTLEEQWELVPGVWTFELWSHDRKLGEQSFTLIASDRPEPSRRSCDERLVSLLTQDF